MPPPCCPPLSRLWLGCDRPKCVAAGDLLMVSEPLVFVRGVPIQGQEETEPGDSQPPGNNVEAAAHPLAGEKGIGTEEVEGRAAASPSGGREVSGAPASPAGSIPSGERGIRGSVDRSVDLAPAGSIPSLAFYEALLSAPTGRTALSALSQRVVRDLWARRLVGLLSAGVGEDGERGGEAALSPPLLGKLSRHPQEEEEGGTGGEEEESGGRGRASSGERGGRGDGGGTAGPQRHGGRTRLQAPSGRRSRVGGGGIAPPLPPPPPLPKWAAERAVMVGLVAEACQDPAAAGCRGEPLAPFAAVWPELALVNHSCRPNAVALVVGDRVVLR